MSALQASIADFESLAAMPGLDIYFVGPTDLSISLGVPVLFIGVGERAEDLLDFDPNAFVEALFA